MLEFYREDLALKEKEVVFDLVKNEIDLANFIFGEWPVITSYSIHYTKLYEPDL